MNKSTISVNVFGLDAGGKKVIGPLFHTKEPKSSHKNLLYPKNQATFISF